MRWKAIFSWFWDPSSQWMISACCPLCRTIIPVDQDHDDLTTNIQGRKMLMNCPECHSEFIHEMKLVNGDPRSIALIGHWDGWQSFSTSSKHGSGIYQLPTYVSCML